MAHLNRGPKLSEMHAQLGEASDVSRDDHLGSRRDDCLRLFSAERCSDRRLIKIVGASATAAQVGFSEFAEFQAGNAPQ